MTSIPEPPDRPLVLLIDDDDELRAAAAAVLGHAGFDVSEVRTGTAALDVLDASPRVPDVVVSGLGKPPAAAHELVKTLGTRPRFRDLALILWSVFDVPDDSRTHPERFASLVAAVSAACRASRARRERARGRNSP